MENEQKFQEQQTDVDLKNAAVSESECDDVEAPARKLLKRELNALALKRLEENAKTVEDFENVVNEWDDLDETRERRERYHEVRRNDTDFPIELGAAISTGFATNLYLIRQASKGNFLEIIFDTPDKIQEHIADEYLYKILRDLKPEYKELLYLRAFVGYSNREIAEMQECTDRNIRKKWNKMIEKIQEKAYKYLTSEKAEKHHDFTVMERAFVKRYSEKQNIEKKNKNKLKDK